MGLLLSMFQSRHLENWVEDILTVSWGKANLIQFWYNTKTTKKRIILDILVYRTHLLRSAVLFSHHLCNFSGEFLVNIATSWSRWEIQLFGVPSWLCGVARNIHISARGFEGDREREL